MSEKVNINNKSKSKHNTSTKAEIQPYNISLSEYPDKRPESVKQRKLQENANNSTQLRSITEHQQNAEKSSISNKITQLREINSSPKQPTIQLQNKLTMHHKTQPKEKQKAGGGVGSSVSTEREVQQVISDGVKEDVKDSKNALDQSIGIREEEQKRLGGDAGHTHRIAQEKTWRDRLKEWINKNFPKKQKRKNQEATDEEWGNP